jgi:hypothetical protein
VAVEIQRLFDLLEHFVGNVTSSLDRPSATGRVRRCPGSEVSPQMFTAKLNLVDDFAGPDRYWIRPSGLGRELSRVRPRLSCAEAGEEGAVWLATPGRKPGR